MANVEQRDTTIERPIGGHGKDSAWCADAARDAHSARSSQEQQIGTPHGQNRVSDQKPCSLPTATIGHDGINFGPSTDANSGSPVAQPEATPVSAANLQSNDKSRTESDRFGFGGHGVQESPMTINDYRATDMSKGSLQVRSIRTVKPDGSGSETSYYPNELPAKDHIWDSKKDSVSTYAPTGQKVEETIKGKWGIARIDWDANNNEHAVVTDPSGAKKNEVFLNADGSSKITFFTPKKKYGEQLSTTYTRQPGTPGHEEQICGNFDKKGMPPMSYFHKTITSESADEVYGKDECPKF
jgi:hypothetical protein